MSARRARPLKSRPEPHKPSPETGRGSLFRSIWLAALGTLLSAAFFSLLFLGDNMLSSIVGSDLANLDISAPRERLRREFSSRPQARKHVAAAQLLETLTEMAHHQKDATAEASTARDYVAADPENLISRLACATIIDSALSRSRTTDQRLDALREIIEAPPPTTTATLYNEELLDEWRRALAQSVARADSAYAIAPYIYHFEIDDHYAALPMIRDRLGELARLLRSEGKVREPDQCERWLARMALGLIKSDRDANTRLLCVEFLSRLPKTRDIARIRDDFYSRVERAPLDLASPGKTPALDPDAYTRAFRRLVISVCLAVEGLGAAGLALFAGIMSLVLQRGPAEGEPKPSRGDIASRLSTVVLLGLAPPIIICDRIYSGLPSQSWALMAAPATAAFGAIATIAFAGRRRVAILPLICGSVTLAAIAAPALITRLYQPMGKPLPGFLGVVAALSLMITVSLVGSPIRWRPLASRAIGAWCWFSALAIVFLLLHLPANRAYREAHLAGCKDEFAARLGADWEERYLRPAERAYNETATAPANP